MSLEKAKELLEKEVRPALWYALEKNPKLASELLSKMFEEVLAVIVKMDKDLSQRISDLTENVNNLSKRVDEINTQLSQRISDLTENVNKLSRIVKEQASTIGKLSKRYARLEEVELGIILGNLCFSRGLEVDKGFIAKGKPAVDVIITGKKVIALVEIAVRGGSKDIKQLLRASKAYEEVYNSKPDVLFLLCVEKPDELTVKRAEKEGIIVTMRPGEIARMLEKMEKA